VTARDRRPCDDAGFTLIETVVGMVVMSVFLALFTGSVVSMFGSSNHSQAVAHSAQEISNAFTKLDRQVRYASYVGEPGQDPNDGGNWYVEFQNTNTNPATCYQLRVDQGSETLQQRSWSGSGTPSGWQQLATGVLNGGGSGVDAPFVVTAATGTVTSAELTVHLVTGEGTGSNAAQSQSSMTFTALNSTVTTPIRGICAGMRP
jgi:prepilin-type N-terminal cleavage/methylation domain-containing protein